MPWSKLFYDPIILPDGRQLNSLRDAAHHITDLPKAEHDAVEWQLAMEALMLVAATDSPELLAQIAVVKALNRNQRQKPMTGRQTELVGMGYLTDAKAYLKAGNALSQSDVDMYSPVYFLLCHGIELSLKGIHPGIGRQ